MKTYGVLMSDLYGAKEVIVTARNKLEAIKLAMLHINYLVGTKIKVKKK